MGRPRKQASDLPERVYFRHGAYYWVSPEGKWRHLGKVLAVALGRLSIVSSNDIGLMDHLKERVIPTARNNARGRKLSFNLTESDLIDMANAAKWRCAVTGIRFTLDLVGKAKRKPFAPSIDRLDCSIGYEPSNCRLVCVAVNIAMGDWGQEVFDKLALFHARKLLESRYPEAI